MKVVRTVAELRSVLEPGRRGGLTIGLVPTMGALHEGHLSLAREGRRARPRPDDGQVSRGRGDRRTRDDCGPVR